MSTSVPDLVRALLQRPIAFHPILAELAGSVTAGLMASQAIYWTPKTRNADGWFYKSQAEWKEEIALSRCEQETARKVLRSTPWWKEKRAGNPAKLYFRVDLEALALALSQYAGNQHSRMLETGSGKPADKNAGFPQSLLTETTSEPAQQRGNTRARARLYPRVTPADKLKEIRDRETVQRRNNREEKNHQAKLEFESAGRGPQAASIDKRNLREELANLEWIASSAKTPPADLEFAHQRITELRAALAKLKGAAA